MTDPIFPPDGLPILTLRNSVMFPASIVPVNVGRESSVRLIDSIANLHRPLIGVLTQIRPEIENPKPEELFQMGTIARVLKIIRLGKGYSIVLQGQSRMAVQSFLSQKPFYKTHVEKLVDHPQTDEEVEALAIHLREKARSHIKIFGRQSTEVSGLIDKIRSPGALADFIASRLAISVEKKQSVLETLQTRDRIRKVLGFLEHQIQVVQEKRKISKRVREDMSRSQREYLLREQMKLILQELGELDEVEEELEQLRQRLVETDLPDEPKKSARKQLNRMGTMSPSNPEFQVSRTYVEWILDLPWQQYTSDRMDIEAARTVLDEDHFGLDKPKRRILEHLAILKLRSSIRGPILCFVGPPGVGKTSLARSIAKAMGRNFVRVSLGGVSDEAEIRGHRRTYVGAFPGRIISALKKAESLNPVILLDEVDKVQRGSRGDSTGALLEMLDPEQNSEFVDHYMDLPVDLSKVLFIATANQRGTIPVPLLDRMEMIHLAGYTPDEKRAIAEQFLIPKQLCDHGLTPEKLEIPTSTVEQVIEQYTHEAGVRTLEKTIASICRHEALIIAENSSMTDDPKSEIENTPTQSKPTVIGSAELEKILGPPKRLRTQIEKRSTAGLASGLVWTPYGGEIMFVESSQMSGDGKIHLTGSAGDIMKETVYTALSYLRSKSTRFGLQEDFLDKVDLHIHIQEAGSERDGASAGMPVFISLLSLFKQEKIRPQIAFSGELTLRGRILKVLGVKEKCLAAFQAGITEIILPKENEPDLEELSKDIRKQLRIHLVEKVDEILPIVMGDNLRNPSASIQA